MPIYAPTLPPRPNRNQGSHPILVLLGFDLRRALRQKAGLVLLVAMGLILAIRLLLLYQTPSPQGAEFQADWLPGWFLWLLWFLVATTGGGLVARDTLYRIRPLIYAHPVRPTDYLLAKGILSAGVPLVIQLPCVLLPWVFSLSIAGREGPVWITAPLHLLPATLVIALLMGVITLGASSLAATPGAGIAWVLSILLGTEALSSILAAVLKIPELRMISPVTLAAAWPQLCCGVSQPSLGWGGALAGTLGHGLLWTTLAWTRTRPAEAIV